jgi:uncharacterized YigZ family protein
MRVPPINRLTTWLYVLLMATTVPHMTSSFILKPLKFRVLKSYVQGTTARMCATKSQRIIAPGLHEAEMEVKKSRFIGYATHVDSWPDAQRVLQDIKNKHPKARHWCIGYQGGADPVNERSSDDGEPSGTAGAPIIAAIRAEALSDTLCVVVRYFGGIKLGTGGLIRAYGGAARLVLKDAPVIICLPRSSVTLTVDASYVGVIYDTIGKVGGAVMEEAYGADGSLTVTLTCETNQVDRFESGLKDATSGIVSFHCRS